MRKSIWFPVFVAVLLTLGWAIYFPGISGAFLFDDFANLPALGKYGPIDNLENLRLYLTGGIAGPTGRPVALASFLLDARDWPADPGPFLVTNIAIHVFNGVLLGILLLRILRLYWPGASNDRRIFLVACSSALWWMMNPFLVSTTLYIVQRMTLLSATFVLVGLNGYLHGRMLLGARPGKAYAWMTTSLVLGTFLAALSKENGILLPLFCLIMEWTLVEGRRNVGSVARWWKMMFLVIPSLLPFAYFLFKWPSLVHGYESRDFSMLERLATESVILFEYLYNLYIPHFHTAGLFNDSHSIYSFAGSWHAILSLFCVLLLLAYAIYARKKYKLASLAILFYFGGHLLESTVVPLELYFEHRNYMTSVFLFLPVSAYFIEKLDVKKWALMMFSALAISAYFAHERAELWGDPVRLLLTWVGENPDSTRTQIVTADELLRLGGYGVAISQLDSVLRMHPDNTTLQLRRLLMKINAGKYDRSDLAGLSETLAKTKWDFRPFTLMESFVESVQSRASEKFTAEEALKLFDLLSENPSAGPGTGPNHLLQHVRGELFLLKGDRNASLEAFLDSLASRPIADAGMKQVAILASDEAFEEALIVLDKVDLILEKDSAKYTEAKNEFLRNESRRIRKQIYEDMGK